MPSAAEKQRRKQLAQQLHAKEAESLLTGLPLSLVQLQNLFDYLDAQLSETGCDDTLRLTKQFAADVKVPFDTLKTWLGEQGGYCDCEVLANVEEKFEDIV